MLEDYSGTGQKEYRGLFGVNLSRLPTFELQETHGWLYELFVKRYCMNRRFLLKALPCTAAAGWLQQKFDPISTAVFAAGRTSALPKGPAWLADAVFYEVYPQSFCDTNGDGIGDLPGIISKLDYIRSIGCNAIWLNPFFDSPFGDAGYDVRDFLKVAPRYGSNDDAARLMREAHARGMHVCLDLVAGHTSIENAWFKASSLAEKSLYSDWFQWVPKDAEVPNSFPAPAIAGMKTREEKYVANFFSFQPGLNYGYYQPDPAKPWQLSYTHPACREVQQNLRNVMKFWLDLGVDGFRVDMASSLIRGDKDGDGIRLLWKENRQWLDGHYPEAVLISEWSFPRRAIPAGFNIDFLIHFNEPAYKDLIGPEYAPSANGGRAQNVFFERSGKGDITKFVESYLQNYTPTKSLGYIAMPTANHDIPRPTWGRSIDEVKVVYTMLLTMPGVPFIYYGDEIGMKYMEHSPDTEGANKNNGIRAGSRTPMQWDGSANAGFSTAPASELYLPIDADPDRPNVASQEKDPYSMLNFVRALLKIRKNYPALGNAADFKVVYAEKEQYPFVYMRSNGEQKVLVALNPSERKSRIEIREYPRTKPLIVQGAKCSAGALEMQGISFGVFLVEA